MLVSRNADLTFALVLLRFSLDDAIDFIMGWDQITIGGLPLISYATRGRGGGGGASPLYISIFHISCKKIGGISYRIAYVL